jgi:hypothetical protein
MTGDAEANRLLRRSGRGWRWECSDSLLEDFPCENLRIELRQAVESYTARLDSEIERVRAAVTGSSISPGRIASLTNASQVFGFLAYEVW